MIGRPFWTLSLTISSKFSSLSHHFFSSSITKFSLSSSNELFADSGDFDLLEIDVALMSSFEKLLRKILGKEIETVEEVGDWSGDFDSRQPLEALGLIEEVENGEEGKSGSWGFLKSGILRPFLWEVSTSAQRNLFGRLLHESPDAKGGAAGMSTLLELHLSSSTSIGLSTCTSKASSVSGGRSEISEMPDSIVNVLGWPWGEQFISTYAASSQLPVGGERPKVIVSSAALSLGSLL